jgi:hypothetical protein
MQASAASTGILSDRSSLYSWAAHRRQRPSAARVEAAQDCVSGRDRRRCAYQDTRASKYFARRTSHDTRGHVDERTASTTSCEFLTVRLGGLRRQVWRCPGCGEAPGRTAIGEDHRPGQELRVLV